MTEEFKCAVCTPKFCECENTGWISVKDKMPFIPYSHYLTYGDGGVSITQWIGKDNPDRHWEHTGWKLPYNVTHWMPLPEPPKSQRKKNN